MASKTYDRAQVLQVAAQIYAGKGATHAEAVQAATKLIDEVERQCPLQVEPIRTNEPVEVRRGPCGMRWHSSDCDCRGEGGDR